MSVYGWLAILLAILASFGWVARMSYKAGQKQGREDANEYWSKKVQAIYDRLGNPDDDGVDSVSDGSVWKGPKTGTGTRVESSSGTGNTNWGAN